MATTHVNSSVDSEITTVSSRRSPINSPTGRRCSNEWPKSPRTNPETHFRYWTWNGSPSPYCAFNASSVAASTRSPLASRLAAYVVR